MVGKSRKKKSRLLTSEERAIPQILKGKGNGSGEHFDPPHAVEESAATRRVPIPRPGRLESNLFTVREGNSEFKLLMTGEI
ncbi:hypothetical protein CGLAMM_08130 [Acetobacteraceae bacterium EV16G]|uniref:Uncharacterized protein n=1 Tax=Sorlinia euscelidii TaxID=3081148 RepID=A0ABU7U3F0_9PROT